MTHHYKYWLTVYSKIQICVVYGREHCDQKRSQDVFIYYMNSCFDPVVVVICSILTFTIHGIHEFDIVER